MLVREDVPFDRSRYYTNPVMVYGDVYYICSQWFEAAANNDRPYLIKWIEEHKH